MKKYKTINIELTEEEREILIEAIRNSGRTASGILKRLILWLGNNKEEREKLLGVVYPFQESEESK